jgi:hypothetical protein
MDANGARELSKRLEAHEHWRQAPAVLRGEQPATDPDAPDLEELGDGIRLYRREVQAGAFNGASSHATQRLCKRLVDGRWETSYEAEPLGS